MYGPGSLGYSRNMLPISGMIRYFVATVVLPTRVGMIPCSLRLSTHAALTGHRLQQQGQPDHVHGSLGRRVSARPQFRTDDPGVDD